MHLRPDKKILLQINSIKISYNYIISYTPPPPSTAYLPNEKTHIHVKFGFCLLQYCLSTHLALFVHAMYDQFKYKYKVLSLLFNKYAYSNISIHCIPIYHTLEKIQS